jgi:hypothetical protein
MPAQPNLIWPAVGEYAGSKKCAVCHPAEAKTYYSSSMFRALEPVDSCEILKQNRRMEWTNSQYRYLIEKADKGYRYSVTDGSHTVSAMLAYAFGQGKAGQTYIFEQDGHYFESRVSYYQELKGLGLTVGALNAKPSNIQQALGRPMDDADTRDCFGCHATAARRGLHLQLRKFENGVQCEACHGPGEAHIESIVGGKPKPGSIRSLRGMSGEDANEFCGTCHRTWEAVNMMRIHGTSNARFQPYRLTNSHCFASDDGRIACTACHNPHTRLDQDRRAYDSKCTACHNTRTANSRMKTCPVAKQACPSCHMPRYEVPGSHHAFSDHWIRVARSGEPYPD